MYGKAKARDRRLVQKIQGDGRREEGARSRVSVWSLLLKEGESIVEAGIVPSDRTLGLSGCSGAGWAPGDEEEGSW